jgi:hypothetical protein
VVNEVASKGTNLAICGGEAYIEFKNIGTFPIDPSDFVVIVEALPNLNRALVKDLDSSTVLDGGAFLVVCSTASFNINGAEEVRLIAPVEESLVSNPDDGVVSTTGRLPGFGFESKAQSFQRLSDESGYVLAKPTPGNENAPGMYLCWLADPLVTRPSESKLSRTPCQTTRNASTFLTLFELLLYCTVISPSL